MAEGGFDYNRAYQQGNGRYLADGEDMAEIIAQDQEVFDREGVNRHEVAQSLRALFAAFNDFKQLRDPSPQELIPGVHVRKKTWGLGRETVTIQNHEFSSYRDYWIWIDDEENGNKVAHPEGGPTVISEMIPDMLDTIGFLEGSVYYGVKADWLIRLHRRIQENPPKPYIPKITKDAWDGFRWYASFDREQERPASAVNTIMTGGEQVYDDNAMTIYIAPGELDLDFYGDGRGIYSSHPEDPRRATRWGLIIAHEDVQLDPDIQINGLPIDASNPFKLKRGEVEIIRVFPYTDKLVG